MDASLGSSLTRIRSTGSDAVVSDQKRVVAIKRAPAPSTSRARVASRRVDAARGSVAGSTARGLRRRANRAGTSWTACPVRNRCGDGTRSPRSRRATADGGSRRRPATPRGDDGRVRCPFRARRAGHGHRQGQRFEPREEGRFFEAAADDETRLGAVTRRSSCSSAPR